jgi:hypothetical protein
MASAVNIQLVYLSEIKAEDSKPVISLAYIAGVDFIIDMLIEYFTEILLCFDHLPYEKSIIPQQSNVPIPLPLEISTRYKVNLSKIRTHILYINFCVLIFICCL